MSQNGYKVHPVQGHHNSFFFKHLCSAFGLRNKSLGTTFKEQSEYLGSHNPLKMILLVGCKLQTHQIIVKMTLVD